MKADEMDKVFNHVKEHPEDCIVLKDDVRPVIYINYDREIGAYFMKSGTVITIFSHCKGCGDDRYELYRTGKFDEDIVVGSISDVNKLKLLGCFPMEG